MECSLGMRSGFFFFFLGGVRVGLRICILGLEGGGGFKVGRVAEKRGKFILIVVFIVVKSHCQYNAVFSKLVKFFV